MFAYTYFHFMYTLDWTVNSGRMLLNFIHFIMYEMKFNVSARKIELYENLNGGMALRPSYFTLQTIRHENTTHKTVRTT